MLLARLHNLLILDERTMFFEPCRPDPMISIAWVLLFNHAGVLLASAKLILVVGPVFKSVCDHPFHYFI